MKLIQLWITSALLICLWWICGATTITLGQKQFDTIIEAQTFIEDNLSFDEIQITNPFPYSVVYSLLDQGCGKSDQHEQISKLKSIWGQNLSNWNIQSEMQRYFETLKKMIISTNKLKGEQEFCQQKYILYSLLEHSQQLYTSSSSSFSIKSSNNKMSKDTEHQSAEEIKSNIKMWDIWEYHLSLHNYTQNIKQKTHLLISQLTEKIIQKEIWILLEKGLLNIEDINTLDGKIEINYVNSCGITKGSYHMMERIWGSNRTLKAIRLNINLCSDSDYLNNFEKYVKQIFIHELAHYFYYFKDNNSQSFEEICWENENNICTINNFVSDYAQKNKEEDYAESFTYRYLGYLNNKEHNTSHISDTLRDKFRHFSHYSS